MGKLESQFESLELGQCWIVMSDFAHEFNDPITLVVSDNTTQPTSTS